MRKCQSLFLALALLCLAIPAFADGGSTALNLVPIGAGLAWLSQLASVVSVRGRPLLQLAKPWLVIRAHVAA